MKWGNYLFDQLAKLACDLCDVKVISYDTLLVIIDQERIIMWSFVECDEMRIILNYFFDQLAN